MVSGQIENKCQSKKSKENNSVPQQCVHNTHILFQRKEKKKKKMITSCYIVAQKLMVCQPRIPGEGNGNPFQYSCLGNPMDREAW